MEATAGVSVLSVMVMRPLGALIQPLMSWNVRAATVTLPLMSPRVQTSLLSTRVLSHRDGTKTYSIESKATRLIVPGGP